MKKLLFAFALLLSIGAGCLPVANKPVEGDWYLAFNLPEGWIMVEPYHIGDDTSLETDISRENSELVLQNSDKPLCQTSGAPCPEGSIPLEGDLMRVRVMKLDSRRVLPENLEDLGKGFYRLKLCEDNEDCRIAGAGNYEYYLKADDANYKFMYAGDTKTAEKVIKSAKVVTKFTDEDENAEENNGFVE